MNGPDPLLQRLAELSAEQPAPDLSRKIRSGAHAKLVPARVHPLWCFAVAASVVGYLCWALHFTSQLY
jgi:hypothetical protein